MFPNEKIWICGGDEIMSYASHVILALNSHRSAISMFGVIAITYEFMVKVNCSA